MHNITKKLIVSIVTIAMAFTLAAPASATTADELQAQITALLAQIQTLQAQLSAAQGAGTAGTAACAGITFSRTLKLGMSGTDVKCLQSILNQAADTQIATTGAGSPGNETTYFGAKTKTAVIKYQQKYASEVLTPVGLTVGTGLVGAKTIAKLNTVVGTAGTGTTGTGTTGTGTTVVLPTASGLTVAVASDNPVAGTIISDGASAVAGSQALVPYLKLNFSTPAGTSAKVTTLKFKRLGVCSDTDFPNAYLYEGGTKLAEMTSLSAGVMTFTNSAGLFTVSGAKTITVRADLHQDATAGKTLGVGLTAATDVVTDATAVNGTFPMNGNLMTVAVVTDFGRLTIATSSNSVTVDPGTTGFEAFRIRLTSANQKIKVSYLRFTQLGSIAKTDISNIALYAGSTQLGTTQTGLASDGSVTFDLSAAPYEIPSGVVRTLSLKVDVIGGSTRTIQFSMQRSSDIVVDDANYGVSVRPDTTAIGTFTVLDSSATTVGAGNLVISRRTDSPSGNVALNASSITLAKFDVRAVGEDIKVSNLPVIVASTTAWNDYVNNVKIFFDGVQVGTTQTTIFATTTVTLNFTVPVGQTKILEIKSDIAGTHLAAGILPIAAGSGMAARFGFGTNNAQRQTSLGSFGFPASDQAGNTLTVSAAGLSASKNVSIGDISAVNNQQGITIGSFNLTAGSAEGITVNRLTFRAASTTINGAAAASGTAANSLGAAFANLKLFYGTTQLGTTVTPNVGDVALTEYSFYPTGLSLVAGQSILINLKGDVLAGATWQNGNVVCLLSAEGTGAVTTNSANIGTANDSIAGQLITISGAGVLSLAIDSSTPVSSIAAMGSTDLTLGIWKLSANNTEDLTITKILALSMGDATSSGTVENLKLYCGSEQYGTTADGFITPVSLDRYAPFAGTCVIPKGSYKLITLKGSISAFGSGPYSTGGVGYYVMPRDYLSVALALPSPITGVADQAMTAIGSAGAYASTTAIVTSTANVVYPRRADLRATMVVNGLTSNRSRAATDKIANLTLSSAVGTAYLRAATSGEDDIVSGVWASSTLAPEVQFWASNTTFSVTSTISLDGSSAIWWRTASTTGLYGTTTFIAMYAGAVPSTYSRVSFWIRTTSVGTTTFFVSDSTSTGSDMTFNLARLGTAATTSITSLLTANTWSFVDLGLTTSTNGVIATTGSIVIGLAQGTGYDGTHGVVNGAIDAVKFYNDSIVVNISGNTSSSATGTALYLQTSGGTEVARGFLAKYGTVNFIPSSEIAVSTAGATYELVANTQTLMEQENVAGICEGLQLSTTLGTAASAGDIRWFDNAVDPLYPMTWLNGASPITASICY